MSFAFSYNPLAEEIQPQEIRVPGEPFAEYDQSVVENSLNSLIVLQRELERKLPREEQRHQQTASCIQLVQQCRIAFEAQKSAVHELLPQVEPPLPAEPLVSHWSPSHTVDRTHQALATSLDEGTTEMLRAWRHRQSSVFSAADTESHGETVPSTADYGIACGLKTYLTHFSDAIQRALERVLPTGSLCVHPSLAELLAGLIPLLTSLLNSCSTLTQQLEAAENNLHRHTLLVESVHRSIHSLMENKGAPDTQESQYLTIERDIYRRLCEGVQQTQILLDAALSSYRQSTQNEQKDEVGLALIGEAVDFVRLERRRLDLLAESRWLGTNVIALRQELNDEKVGWAPFHTAGAVSSSHFLTDADEALAAWTSQLAHRLERLHVAVDAGEIPRGLSSGPPSSEVPSFLTSTLLSKADREESCGHWSLEAELHLLQAFLEIQHGCLRAVAVLNGHLTKNTYNVFLLLHLVCHELELELDKATITAVFQDICSVDLSFLESEALSFLNAESVTASLTEWCAACKNKYQLEADRQQQLWSVLLSFLRGELSRDAPLPLTPPLPVVPPASVRVFQPALEDPSERRAQEEEVSVTQSVTTALVHFSEETLHRRQGDTEKRMQWFRQQRYAPLLLELLEVERDNRKLEQQCAEWRAEAEAVDELDSPGESIAEQRREVEALEEEWRELQERFEKMNAAA